VESKGGGRVKEERKDKMQKSIEKKTKRKRIISIIRGK
jgi:hypothetical protein